MKTQTEVDEMIQQESAQLQEVSQRMEATAQAIEQLHTALTDLKAEQAHRLGRISVLRDLTADRPEGDPESNGRVPEPVEEA